MSLKTDRPSIPQSCRRNRLSNIEDCNRLKYYVLANESPLNSDNDTDSVLSIQARETDYVRDTSDTESYQSDLAGEEYELATDPEDEEYVPFDMAESSAEGTDSEIITTKVISVSVLDEGDLEFADSEDSTCSGDPELEPNDYWQCAQCRNTNNNPLYRYCEKCFKVRKNFFPPRPKRKTKHTKTDIPVTNHYKSCSRSADSGVESVFNSQEILSNEDSIPQIDFQNIKVPFTVNKLDYTQENVHNNTTPVPMLDSYLNFITKRKLENRDIPNKRRRLSNSSSDSYSSDDVQLPSRLSNSFNLDVNNDIKSKCDASIDACEVAPVLKTLSDPAINVQSLDVHSETVEQTKSSSIRKKALIQSLKEKLENGDENNCIVCLSAPKSGVFVHGRIAHICCCYKCALKVWAKAKRCPVCNCKVSNVLKAVVM